MAITMRDRFVVRAPMDEVWEFLMDPRRIIVCMPGAHLDAVESDRAFRGRIKIAVGPFSTSYRGRVQFTEVDEAAYRVRAVAEGHESGGGDAHGSMVSYLLPLDGGTDVEVEVVIDGTSKLVRMGLGLTENLAHEMFAQFVECVKERLETPGPSTHHEHQPEPVQVVPLIAKALVRRLRGKHSN
jgi:carbon monoxide dehydrogenase subunit G